MFFGERLKKLRDEKGLTQQDVADFLGVGRPTVAGYETKGKQPDHDKLKQLSTLFDVSIDYLVGKSDIRNPYIEKESLEKKHSFATKAYHNLDVGGLSDEDISKVEEYIDLLKQKYNPDGTLKKKD